MVRIGQKLSGSSQIAHETNRLDYWYDSTPRLHGILQDTEVCLKYSWKSLRLHPSQLCSILGKCCSPIVRFYLQTQQIYEIADRQALDRNKTKAHSSKLNTSSRVFDMFSCLLLLFWLISNLSGSSNFLFFLRVLNLSFLINLWTFRLPKILIKWKKHKNLKEYQPKINKSRNRNHKRMKCPWRCTPAGQSKV